jgi:hypothetical protein
MKIAETEKEKTVLQGKLHFDTIEEAAHEKRTKTPTTLLSR